MTLITTQRSVKNRREIVSRKDLTVAVTKIIESSPQNQWRGQVLTLIKTAFSKGFDVIKHRHLIEGITGREAALANCYLADQLIRIIFDFTTRHIYPLNNPTKSEHMTLVATGGYGRQEMAPYSDIDLLFLVPKKHTPWCENASEYILYFLWDLGWKVGHAIRSPEECVRYAKEDITIRTSLLESRYIWGDETLFSQTRKMFVRKVISGTGTMFVSEKLAERDARHIRMGDTRYVVEPNLKDGKGGMRDLQTLWWIAKYLYNVRDGADLIEKGFLTKEEFRQFRKAEDFLWTVRCTLHYIAGRAEERLTFDRQRELAEHLHYFDRKNQMGVERFMKHYFLVAKKVGDLTRVFCAVLENRHHATPILERFKRNKKLKGFVVEGDRLNFVGPDDLIKNPTHVLKIFHVAHHNALDIHPDALRIINRNLTVIDGLRDDPQANALFMDMLTSIDKPEKTLKRLNEAGVLGRFLPDFGRVVAQMQFDMYHHYTVDEHTIQAIGLLAAIERGELNADHPVASRVIQKVLSRRVLYVAVLLHDIAKGRGGDHSILGAEVANKLCPRLGLTLAETENVAWLVRHHLDMSHIAFKRDLMDPKTIRDFAEHVKSPELLRLLITLTVVDIRAVGPGVWNGWKGQLLRDLYYSTNELLVAGHATSGRAERVKAKQDTLAKRLKGDWSKAAINKHFKKFNDSYWIAEEDDTLLQNANLMKNCGKQSKGINFLVSSDSFQAITLASVCTADDRGIFARLAGAMGIAGASILGAKIHTTTDGIAVDNFTLQGFDNKPFDQIKQIEKLEQVLNQAMKGSVKIKERLDQRRPYGNRNEIFTLEPKVLIDNNASNQSTVIEVNAKDRPGLLYDLVYTLYRLKLNIFSAHVATYGEQATDVFYVQDLAGRKLANSIRLKNIEEKLSVAARGVDLDEESITP